jgi:hypothetical protein
MGLIGSQSRGGFCALLLVSGRVYIVNMRVSPATEATSNPVFIEVTNPVNLMTPSEKGEFIEEILKAFEGK